MFFSPESLERYVGVIAEASGLKTQTIAELEAGRYRAVHLRGERELFELAKWAGAECLVWDPDPEDETQQVYRIPE